MSHLGFAFGGWEAALGLGVVNNTPHCGLQNEGATCYLNSYLQALFHLPRFRRAVYDIDTNSDGYENPTVSLALQCVFYKLQTNKGSSVSTRILTRSFEEAKNWKWSTMERFTQHDVHEFSRKLIDELEPKMSGLKKMFCGTEKTVVRWREGEGEQTKNMDQEFYDLLLNVKGCVSLESALEQFCLPEFLEGDNQYDTGAGRKDAVKSTFFDMLPPVLSLNLKRFEADEMKLGSYKKVNDSQSFPETLVLPTSCITSNVSSATYKLYAVLSHSGTVSSGHYFAFMRPNLYSTEWFKFDDQSVYSVKPEEAMDNNFGGNGSANAYMLIYIEESHIPEYFSACEIPQNISDKFCSEGGAWNVQNKYHVKINFGGESPESTLIECNGVDHLMSIAEEVTKIPIDRQIYWNCPPSGRHWEPPVPLLHIKELEPLLNDFHLILEEVTNDQDSSFLFFQYLEMTPFGHNIRKQIFGHRVKHSTTVKGLQEELGHLEGNVWKRMTFTQVAMLDSHLTVGELGLKSGDSLLLSWPEDGSHTNLKSPCEGGWGYWANGKRVEFTLESYVQVDMMAFKVFLGFNQKDNPMEIVRHLGGQLPHCAFLALAVQIREKQLLSLPRFSNYDFVEKIYIEEKEIPIAYNMTDDPEFIAHLVLDREGIESGGLKDYIRNLVIQTQDKARKDSSFVPKTKETINRIKIIQRNPTQLCPSIPITGAPLLCFAPSQTGQMLAVNPQVVKKLLEANMLVPIESRMTEQEIGYFQEMTNELICNQQEFDKTNFNPAALDLVKCKLLKWPSAHIPFCVDLIRALILHEKVVSYYLGDSEDLTHTIFEDMLLLAKQNLNNPKVLPFILQFLVNCFNQTQLRRKLFVACQQNILIVLTEVLRSVELKHNLGLGKLLAFVIRNLAQLLYEEFPDNPQTSLRFCKELLKLNQAIITNLPKTDEKNRESILTICEHLFVSIGTLLLLHGRAWRSYEDKDLWDRIARSVPKSPLVTEAAAFVSELLICESSVCIF